jgi:hypothetical protein
MYWGYAIPVSVEAHCTKGPACKIYYTELVLSSLPKFSSVDTAKVLLDPPLLILRRMSSSLRSASALAASWQCQRCDCTNNSAKNKRHCVLCRAWRDRIAPLSASGITIADACSSENNAPNNASPRKVGSPKKRGEKRKSPSRGIGGMALHPLPPPSPPPLRLTRSITPPPPLQCRGVCGGFFGPALTFAAKSMEHIANQLRQWASEPDLGVKSFAKSILSTSRSICVPYQGVLLDRTSNPREGFVFHAESCSVNCSNGKHCSHCASKIIVSRKVRGCIEPVFECVKKQATIAKISRNPALAATEICTIQHENRRLRR